jgi:hypothetical protein
VSAIDETLVREFFELNGFLVRQLAKHQVHARRRRGDESIDLVVYNPRPTAPGFTGEFHVFPSTLRSIRHAVISVVGSHTERLSLARLRSSPELFDFLSSESLLAAQREFPVEEAGLFPELTRLLVIPGLPESEEQKAETIRCLRERGVDGILAFRTLLLDLVSKVEINNNYRKSDVLQVIRLLKNYQVLPPDSQLELRLPHRT